MIAALYCAFFLSGVAALLFETLWFHQAGLALGNSVWASSLVLAGFMGGLGLGNALAARYGQRIRRPLALYAVLEVTIGLSGFLIVVLLPAVGSGLAPAFRPFLDAPWMLNSLRLLVSLVILLAPSTAMGATLPVLVKGLVAWDANFGRVLGRLYGWNTLGAVAGAILGEALLIGWLGIRGSAVAAALVNAIAAAVAMSLSRRVGLQGSPGRRTFPFFSQLPRGSRRLLAAAGLAGGILLALEVMWFRFLLLFVHGSSLAFALMLAVVLTGIAVGGLASSVWLGRRPGAHQHGASVALVAGVLCVAVYAGMRLLIRPVETGYIADWQHTALLALFLMLPVSFCSGVLFPLIGAALRGRLDAETRAAGLLTLANTAGAMLGSLIAGFVLLPALGIEASFFLLASAYGLVALCAPRRPLSRRPIGAALPLYATAGAFVAALALFPFGLMADHYLRIPVERHSRQGPTRVVGLRETVTETIIYLRHELFGEPLSHTLVTNGFSMSGTTDYAKRYMKLFVYWPVAVRPDPRSALLISYGVGSTAKALTDTRSLQTIDVVDISKDILEMSEIVFSSEEENPLRDPRVRVHVEDGRYFLQTTDHRFDLITGEPPPPKKAGVVNLYTREYFRLIRDRLSGDGVATYWLPAHNLLASDSKAIIRAFCDVFDDCSLWGGTRFDWMLVGTRGSLTTATEAEFSRQWEDPVVGRELRALGLEEPEQLGALFMADAAALRALTRGVPPLTDDHPQRLSHGLAGVRSNAIHRSWMNSEKAKTRFLESDWIQRIWPESLRAGTALAFDHQRIINEHFFPSEERRWSPPDDLYHLLTRSSLRTLPLWLLGSTAAEQRIVRRLSRQGMREPVVDLRRALGAIAERDYALAERLLRQAAVRTPQVEDVRLQLAFVQCLAGRFESLEAPPTAQPPHPTKQSPGFAKYREWLNENCGE